MKKDECRKCGRYDWLEQHHILPKATFGDTEEFVWLCASCHTDYHQQLGRENLKNKDIAFHLYFYLRWFYGTLSLSLLLLLWWYLA